MGTARENLGQTEGNGVNFVILVIEKYIKMEGSILRYFTEDH